MIKNVLSDLGGVGLFGVISICLFFTVFLGAVFYSLLVNERHTESMSALPLNDGSVSEPANQQDQPPA